MPRLQGQQQHQTDPAWLGFVTIREAIEEERSVNLSLVRSYTWEHSEFVNGIDVGCDEDVPESDTQPVYFGWTFYHR